MSTKLLMNRLTGQLGLGIRIQFFDKVQAEPFTVMEGYTIAIRKDDGFDGWIISSDDKADTGLWVFANKDFVEKVTEIIDDNFDKES